MPTVLLPILCDQPIFKRKSFLPFFLQFLLISTVVSNRKVEDVHFVMIDDDIGDDTPFIWRCRTVLREQKYYFGTTYRQEG